MAPCREGRLVYRNFRVRRCEIRRLGFYCRVLKRPVYFDVKEHLRVLHRHVFPLFFALCGLVMILIISIQAGKKGADLPPADFIGARIGLVQAVQGADLDPTLAVLSPLEMVLAPESVVFEPADTGAAPDLSSGGDHEVKAAADGRVVVAANGTEGATVILLHEREGRMVETVYRGLVSLRVSVGSQVRRGQSLGVLSGEKAALFSVMRREFPALAVAPSAEEKKGIPEAWRGREADRLSAPPTGEPLEPSALRLEAPAAPAEL